MKKNIKTIIKSISLFKIFFIYKAMIVSVYLKKYRNCKKTKFERYISYIMIFLSHKFILTRNSVKRTRKLLLTSKITDIESSPFFYSIDFSIIPYARDMVIGNLTPNYTVLLHNSLISLINNHDDSNQFLIIYRYISSYCNKCIKYIEKTNSKYKNQKLYHLNRITSDKAETFYEAMQRLLFTNQLLWQENHNLIGMGHLDKILYPYYIHDINNNIMNKNDIYNLVKDFIITIHNGYQFKSNNLLGDTGQIIILGGYDKEQYVCNDLTYMFIHALTELKLPDPKILLRVHRLMPLELLQESIKCIQTGIGSPLFANDEIIIPALIDFGYEEDAYGYGVSACWEPLIIGKSADANNIYSINFIKPLQNLLFSNKYNLSNFNDFIFAYKQELREALKTGINEVSKIKWERAPLLSLFIDNCVENNLDISDHGAKYNNYGFTTVALSNTVNSLININKYVYILKIINLSDLVDILSNNYADNDDLQKLFKNEQICYGLDNDDVLNITNDILEFTSKTIKENTPVSSKHKYKFGLSSPNYITDSVNSPATPDGRNNNSAFSVHISNDKAVDFNSLFAFASKIDYSGNKINGNVVDFMVSPTFIDNNFDKFVSMIYYSFVSGIFEMQFNVISSNLLIQAKKTPGLFRNLVVRVWGFSAYFNDLPDEYKDVLINRVIEHENAHN
jgi:formate C-acetyltransferase